MFSELRYNNNGTIDMTMDHPIYGPIPFTASPDDPEQYGKEIYQKAINGEYGEIAPYIEPEA